MESELLYNILEHDIASLFYDRQADNVPRDWMAKVKAGYKKLAPFFNTARMVQEYTEHYYMPSFERYQQLTTPDLTLGNAFSNWRRKVLAGWKNVRISDVQVSKREVQVGSEIEVNAKVSLNTLTPADVRVEAYYGLLTARGDIGGDAEAVEMRPENMDGNGKGDYVFKTKIACDTSGDRGISVRVMPSNPSLPSPFALGVMSWAK